MEQEKNQEQSNQNNQGFQNQNRQNKDEIKTGTETTSKEEKLPDANLQSENKVMDFSDYGNSEDDNDEYYEEKKESIFKRIYEKIFGGEHKNIKGIIIVIVNFLIIFLLLNFYVFDKKSDNPEMTGEDFIPAEMDEAMYP